MNGQRTAKPGETCTCGRPAVVVYETEKFGDVGYCGIPDGGQKRGGEQSGDDSQTSPGDRNTGALGALDEREVAE